jgi:hypothetical protein
MIRIIVGVLLALLLAYGGVKAYPLIRGPELSITSPLAYESIPGGLVRILGKALHTETLYVNNAPLLIDEEGSFSLDLLLPKGGATLTFTAVDRFGRQETKIRSVYIP